MKSFLNNVVTSVLEKESTLRDITFVMPSQRACVFLKDELINQLKKATFLPKIVSIETYVQELASLKVIDSTQLLFEFYTIYKKETKGEIDSFDAFSQWGSTLLQDFNDIDAYILETQPFFATLKATSRMNNWFQEGEKPTEISKNYLSFFKNIHIYYSKLYAYLLSEGIGYQGMLYREAVSNIEHYVASNKSYIYFIGFNALNKAEEIIFQTLLQQSQATVYWDEVAHDFGSNAFIEKYKAWPYYQKNPFLTYETNNSKQEITFIGTPKNVSQFKHVGELLDKQKQHQDTALVLANESLLPLALNSLPKSVEKLNITMGFPLVDAPIKSVFDLVFKLHTNQGKFQKEAVNVYYYKDIINLMNHAYLRKLFNEEHLILSEITTKIKQQNTFFVSFKDLTQFEIENFEVIAKNVALILQPVTNVSSFLEKCFSLIHLLKNKLQGIEKEMLFQFNKVFLQLENLNNTYGYFTDIKGLFVFFRQLTQQESLSFHGEPLEGLQLMGMLETRALDFETVILTSANEGVLPKGKTNNSFIPFDVKKHFNLPTYHDKDTIFSYHFFRLLKRAKKVFLLYNTETDDFGQGEKSRFLTQLALQNKDIQHYLVSSEAKLTQMPLQEIVKNTAILKTLKTYAVNGISPSALANYIYDPLLFYTQKVLGIRQVDAVEETIAANTLGNVIHDTLDALYKPFVGKYLVISNIDEMKEQVSSLIDRFFKKHYENGDITVGKNKLIVEVAKNFIIRFLNKEQQLLVAGKELKIIATELPLSTTIAIDSLAFPVKIKGIIDRVDELDGVTRIIDYKTGLVEQKHLKMNDFSLFRKEYNLTKAMQVMLYTYLYTQNQNFDFNKPIESGILSFKNFKSGFLKVNFGEGRVKETLITQEHMNCFMNEIKLLISELFNQKIPFQEKENKKY